MSGLLTTGVGSLPKPPYLLQARNQAARGAIEPQALRQLEFQATREWIQAQEELGIDVLVDGEQERGDMATFFAEQMAGFTISGLVRSYGNRYYRKPIAVGVVGRKGPMTLEMYRYAQGLTEKPVKGILTGPYTMLDWSFNEYYPSRAALCLELARALHEEAVDLERAGARYIQIDEPALSTRPEELDLAIQAMAIVTRGLTAHTITHVCYGDFDAVYPGMLGMPVDQIDLEMANSNYDLLEHFRRRPFTKVLGLGVLDVHTHLLESVDQVKRGLRLTLELVPPERIYVDPDCGLKTRTVEEARAKLSVMMEATCQIKAELAID